MPRQARGEYLDPNEVQIVHAVQRCDGRAFVHGKSVVTGKSCEHRRAWFRDRPEPACLRLCHRLPSPEESAFTGDKDWIDDLKKRESIVKA